MANYGWIESLHIDKITEEKLTVLCKDGEEVYVWDFKDDSCLNSDCKEGRKPYLNDEHKE